MTDSIKKVKVVKTESAKLFEVEVITTEIVQVSIPDSFMSEGLIEEWRKGLWHIDCVKDIAEYAARMAQYGDNASHDGLGRINTTSWENNSQEGQVKAVIISEDVEAFVTELGDTTIKFEGCE